ncbi:MAG TPA: ABC transporter substrate-binding protein, partial [Acidobacteriota bacterium]|nr:ABC transporter substrate-binding protein [Acidobacteriota bacterium]
PKAAFFRVQNGFVLLAAVVLWVTNCHSQTTRAADHLMIAECTPGTYGGKLVIAQRAEPKTLQPVFAVDAPSREIIRLMTADLIHINRLSLKTEPALAESWSVSKDGRRYTLQLRPGVLFSDGHRLDADDVVFTFQVYLDEKINSPQRDLLLVNGRPITVRKTGSHTVEFELDQPYAAAERLFDSIAILPRHLLEKAYQEGNLAQEWGLTTDPARIAGLGPFRLKKYIPGDRILLERNPYYWKADGKGKRLPYLDEVIFLSVASEDAQVIRFQAGETDIISRISSENYSVLAKEQQAKGYRLYDLGPSLEYSFLFFNLNDVDAQKLPQVARKQAWFRETAFRQAVSAAIDREGIVRLAFQGRATPLWGHVTPGNKLWLDTTLPKPPRSLGHARELLAASGFAWSGGTLTDAAGEPVSFSIVTSAGNAPRMQMATLIQADLKELGMQVQVVSLEFRSLIDRILKTHDYDACVLGLGSGDADPNPEMNVLLSNGSTHLWHPGQEHPATSWEAEIDRLMKQQVTVLQYAERKKLYDRVQKLMSDNLPLIYLASPNILTAAKAGLGNVRPAILDNYMLWNAETLYWRSAPLPD